MTPGELLEALGTIGDAPEGIERLRQLVLQLAVRGELVPQNSEDEPATKTAARASTEFDDLPPVRGRKAATTLQYGDAALFVCRPPDMLLKPGWALVELSDITRLESGHTPDRNVPEYWGGRYPWIGIRDARQHRGGTITETEHTVTDEGVANSATRPLPPGTLCLSRTASVGYTVLMGTEMCTSQDFVNFMCSSAVLPQYLQTIFEAEYDALKRFAKGAVHSTIYFPEVKAFNILLPPLAEQRRIVAKVDELMALLDELERTRGERDARRAAFRDSALAALQNAEDAEAAHAAWSRIATNLADCITDPADIAPLRQTILQLAVRGRLVPQDPEDVPALTDADEGPTSLLADQTKRRPKRLPSLAPEETPYSPPSGWVWRRLGNTCRLSRGFDLPVNERQNGDTPVYGANGPLGVHNKPAVRAPGVVTGRSGSIGEVHRVFVDFWPLNTALYVERFFGNDPAFIALLLKSVGLERFSSFSAVPTLNRNTAHLEPVLVPPFAEQRRIVAKVDELMAICDKLEQQLTEAKAHQSAFAAAAVHHLDLAQETLTV